MIVYENSELKCITDNNNEIFINNCRDLVQINVSECSILKIKNCPNLTDIIVGTNLIYLKIVNCKFIKTIPIVTDIQHLELNNLVLLQKLPDIKVTRSFICKECPYFMYPPLIIESYKYNNNNCWLHKKVYYKLLHKIRKMKINK